MAISKPLDPQEEEKRRCAQSNQNHKFMHVTRDKIKICVQLYVFCAVLCIESEKKKKRDEGKKCVR
jgi:hypothetical protein